MAKKVYAYTDTVPKSTPYITAGKRYEVMKEDGGLFRAYSDTGYLNAFLWEGCRTSKAATGRARKSKKPLDIANRSCM